MKFAASTGIMRRRHDDRGAVDPILVIASIAVTLILLVAGTFNLGLISKRSADDVAKNDLRMLALTEKAYFAKQLAFTFYDSVNNPTLSAGGYAYQPSNRVAAAACGDGWVAAAKSSTGNILTMTNTSSTFGDQTGAGVTPPSCAPASLITYVVNNVTGATTQPACPAAPAPLGGLTVTQTTSGTTTTMKGSLPYDTDYSLANRWGSLTLTNVRLWVDGVQYCGLASGKQGTIGDESTPPGPSQYTLTMDFSKLQTLNPLAYSRFLTSGVLSYRASSLAASAPDATAHL